LEQKIVMNKAIKFYFTFFEILSILIIVYLLIDKNEFNTEKICALAIIATLSVIGIVYDIYLLRFKLIIGEKDFKFRKFFKIYKFNYDEITGIEYKRVAFGDISYVIKLNKKKVEIAPILKNKVVIDKKLTDLGIFQKYPRYKY